MREILFRGKRKGNNEWVEGYYVFRDVECSDKKQYNYILVHDIYGFIWIEVYKESISQYIGLKDKNGTKIFDGDIISVKNEEGEIYRFEVKFGKCGGTENVGHDVGYMSFYFWRNHLGFALRTDPIYWLNEYGCEVIGNIHDNPELLNQ